MSFDLVLFGGTGDLAWRKLMPALFQAFRHGTLPPDGRIIGVARDDLTDAQYRSLIQTRFDSVEGAKRPNPQEFARFADLLETDQFVGIHPNSAIQIFLEDIASGMGKQIIQRVHVHSFEAVCRMVGAGVGVAIVPRGCVRRYSEPETLNILKIEDPWAQRERLLCRQRGRDLPRFAESFIEHVVRAAREESLNDASQTK